MNGQLGESTIISANIIFICIFRTQASVTAVATTVSAPVLAREPLRHSCNKNLLSIQHDLFRVIFEKCCDVIFYTWKQSGSHNVFQTQNIHKMRKNAASSFRLVGLTCTELYSRAGVDSYIVPVLYEMLRGNRILLEHRERIIRAFNVDPDEAITMS